MEDPILIVTSDGSHSLLNRAMDETYHSRHGAMQESLHVFIENGLVYRARSLESDPIRILEVGFGTGLNAYLAMRWAETHNRYVTFTTLEPHPINEPVWSLLNYAEPGFESTFNQLHASAWGDWVTLSETFRLCKKQETLQETSLEEYDVVFYDAFAPNKQPDMWEYSLLEKTAEALAPGGVFATYCAKGQLKRDLKATGLLVETLPGPPGKKEMVRALRKLPAA